MKNLRYLLFALVAVFAITLIPATALKASAATYVIVYKDGRWGYMEGDYDSTKNTREFYYLRALIRNGDDLFVLGGGTAETLKLDVYLNSISYIGTKDLLVYIQGANKGYIGAGTATAIHGTFNTVTVYRDAKATFYDPVEKIILARDGDASCVANINSLSTVKEIAYDTGSPYDKHYYNFAEGTASVKDGIVNTNSKYYTMASAETIQQVNANLAAAQQQVALTQDATAYAPVFNATYYALMNPDVARALGSTNTTALFNHFLLCGMSEGRIASPNFNVREYRDKYADLDHAFGDAWAGYFLHYLNAGIKEGRTSDKR